MFCLRVRVEDVVFFFRSGYNVWRDPQKPSEILSELCGKVGLEEPQYLNGKVRIGQKIFSHPGYTGNISILI